MPITVEGHHDFAVLERRLAGLLSEARAADRLAPILIIAPTRRLLSHLQVVLAGVFPGLVNVHFLHHDALARAAAAAAGARLPRLLSSRVLDAVVARLLRVTRGPLGEFAAGQPGAAPALRRTLNDLREAGVAPRSARRVEGQSPAARATLELFAVYDAELDRLTEAAGLSDRAGILRAALPHLRAWSAPFRLAIHYGAYDLIGANLTLLGHIAGAGTPVVCLTPHHPEAPAYAAAARFWSEFLGAPPATLAGTAPSGRLLGDRLPGLYDEAAHLPAGASLPAFHAQGPEAELREVALRVLTLHRDRGTPLREIAVVARSLQPYAAALGPVFGEHGLPFTTHATLGALREPRAQAALRLARAALGDYERQPLMDLLRSGLLRVEGRDPSFEAHAWDRLSREWNITAGRTSWTRTLPESIDGWTPALPDDADDEAKTRAAAVKDRRRRQARSLAATVEALARALRPVGRATGWPAWARAFGGAIGTLLDGFGPGGDADAAPPDPGAAAVLEVLAEMGDLEAAGVPFDLAAARDYFESALAECGVRVAMAGEAAGRSEGGVRVLDAMQARGLAFDAVFLIGFNADLVPRRPREDPFLGDADRLRLRQALRVALPIASRSAEEERLLLAHVLGSARSHLVISWQRADGRGRARAPSLALREIARLTRGTTDADGIITGAARIAGHPAAVTKEALREHRLLPPPEARLGAALEAGAPDALLAQLHRLPPAASPDPDGEAALRDGLQMLNAIEEFASADLRFDACPGADAAAPERWSPSRLERLGTCAQKYFFESVLGIAELDQVHDAWELEPADIGRRVHDILREVYADLPRDRPAPPEVLRRALDRLPDAWRRHTGELERRMGADTPVFWRALQSRWLHALERFVQDDTGSLGGAVVLALEEKATASLDLRPGRAARFAGRFDRVVRRPDGTIVVSDYKTSGRLERRARTADALKGRQLQLPLYVLLAESQAERWGGAGAPIAAELLGVGPAYDAGPRAARPPATRVPLDPALLKVHRPAFLETLRVLDDLAAAGRFPLRAGEWCAYCPFQRACRRTHVPTVARLEAAPALRDYTSLRGKSTRRPFLKDVGAAAGEDAS